jgi:hypothetical protein
LRRLKVVWNDDQIEQLAELVHRSQKNATALYDQIERMGKLGWSLGRRTRDGLWYAPVDPYGVFYDIVGDELRVVRVVDARTLTELP